MRSAHIHLVREDEIDDLLSQYAEAPHLEKFDWSERTTEYIRKAHKWENAILVLGGVLLLWLTYLGVGR